MNNDFKVIINFLDPSCKLVALENTTWQNFKQGDLITYKNILYSIESVHADFDKSIMNINACGGKLPK